MPYRRLPNTDQARIRALSAAVEKADAARVYDFAVSLQTLSAARNYLAKFKAAHANYTDCYNRQAQEGTKHAARSKVARLYLSHFVQVLNLAVIRGEVKAAHKVYYGLKADDFTVPDFSADAALIEWGSRIIEGEHKRIGQGGSPIYNPGIAKVTVHFDIFKESYERQRNLQQLTARSLESLAAMRAKADEIILDIWNQVEAKYAHITPPEKRLELCRSYGIIYYYRTSEKLQLSNL